MIVDNRAGRQRLGRRAGGERSPADGLTLLVTSDATITANPYLSSKLPYSAKEFTPIIVLCRGTPVLVVNASVPAKSTQELIALAKAKPGTLNYGSYGVGTYAHLSMEDFKQRTGTDIVHIPYPRRGAGRAGAARRATSSCCCSISPASRRTRRPERCGSSPPPATGATPARPDLPTIAEAGVPGFQTSVWFALFGPPNMPPELVAEDSRRRQQGAGPAADRRSSSRRTASSG